MKREKKKAAASSAVKEFDQAAEVVENGELLGSQVIGLLTPFAHSQSGLILEAYALSKAWASLQVLASKVNYDREVKMAFDFLTSSFVEEMNELLEQAEHDGR